MTALPPSIHRLVREFMRLPAVGERSATRIAHFLATTGRDRAKSLADSLEEMVTSVCVCERCHFLAESALCSICSDLNRNAKLLCVVEKPVDVIAIERVREFRGLYFVLNGLWSPLRGRTTEALPIDKLVRRAIDDGVAEVILALGITVEGDATSLYLARVLEGHNIAVTRLAQGLPKGGELEFADERTLAKAFTGRGPV